MSTIPSSFASESPAYMRSKLPWRIEDASEVSGVTASGRRFGGKLIHYLSGGGLKTFGRTVEQEEAEGRRFRFLVASGLLAAVWLAILIFG